MTRRKNSTKQERFMMIEQFLKSGQSKHAWCKANSISIGTFYRWFDEYHATYKEVSFVALKSEQSVSTQNSTIHNESTLLKSIIIEVGACKIHMPESIDLNTIVQLIEGVNASHV